MGSWFNDRRADDRLVREVAKLAVVVNDLNATLCELTHVLKHKAPRVLGTHVREIEGKDSDMAKFPPIALKSVERVKLATAPLKEDGTPDTTAVVTWTSSAPDQMGVEPLPEHEGTDAEGVPFVIPATHAAWATTPLDSGAAEISAESPGYETDVQPISYSPGQRRRLNLSVGTPVPD